MKKSKSNAKRNHKKHKATPAKEMIGGYSQGSVFSKYASIIISVLLFLIITAAILGYNYFMSSRIAQTTVATNLAARQGILVQSLAKDVMNIDLLNSQNQTQNETISDEILLATYNLKEVATTFDRTLNAFAEGGQTIDDKGERVNLNKITDPAGVKSITNAKAIWDPYKRLIDSFLTSVNNNKINSGTIRFASDYARIFNSRLYREMSDLNQVIAQKADNETNLVKLVQAIGFGLVFLLFLYIVFGALRRLFKVDNALDSARRETTNILETVNEGLFLLDESLVIGTQHSLQLKNILGQRHIAGRHLNDILKSVVPEKDYEVTQDFIEQLFNQSVIEELIYDLNPLDKVQALIKNPDGDIETRYLSFNFSRVYEKQRINNILVSVSDITKSVLLEERLEKERQENDQQLEMLASILHVDAQQMDDFINHVNSVCEKTNIALKRPGRTQIIFNEKLSLIYREAHSIKGEASALGLDSFTNIINNIESEVSRLRDKKDLQGNDFLSVTVLLDKLIELNEKVGDLFHRIGGADLSQQASDAPRAPSTSISNKFFSQFSQEIAKRNHKKVNLQATGFNQPNLAKDKQLLIKDIGIQLIRNAVVHGIETPQERIALGKPEIGNITLSLSQSKDHHALLVVEDDGRGIDFNALLEKARAVDYFKGQQPTKKQLLAFMMSSGVSTQASHNEDAGRGVGTDVIRDRVKTLGGKMAIASESGQLTRFKIYFPLKSE